MYSWTNKKEVNVSRSKMSAEELLQVTDEELNEMEELMGKTEKETRDCVNIIRSWIKQNPHLPDVESKYGYGYKFMYVCM